MSSTRTFDTSRGDNSDYILIVFRKDWINWLVGSSIPPELIKLIIYLLSSERTGLSCCPVGPSIPPEVINLIIDSASSVRTGLSCCLVGPSIVEARILTSGGILALCFSISFNTSSKGRKRGMTNTKSY